MAEQERGFRICPEVMGYDDTQNSKTKFQGLRTMGHLRRSGKDHFRIDLLQIVDHEAAFGKADEITVAGDIGHHQFL